MQNHLTTWLGLAVLTATATTAFADYVWTGTGDGVSLYSEANWLNTLTGGAPPNGAVDNNVEVNVPLLATNGTPGGSGGGGAHLRLGTGHLHVGGTAVFRMSQSASAGIRTDSADAGSNHASMLVEGDGQVLAQYLSKLRATLDGNAQLTLYGGGNPLNNSTVELTSTSARLVMTAESPATFVSEHFSKVTVNGLPAVTGADLAVFEPGDNLTIVAAGAGCIVQAAGEIILIEAFSASPETINPGGTATLSWAVNEPFDRLTISPGLGDVSAITVGGIGSTNVSPGSTITYTLMVTGNGFTDTAVATVAVAGPADVRINELMAVNNSTLADQDGDFADWIELINRGGTTADLSQWYLTDNPATLRKWQFPAGVALQPGELLVVFASEKNRRVATNELHTSFRLTGDGEYLALVRPDGSNVVAAMNPSFPPLPGDVSYGLSLGSDTLVYFLAPTPRLPNQTGSTNLGPVVREFALTAPSPNRSPENGPLDEILIVTARVRPALHAVTNVSLRYRFQYDAEAAVPMSDDGVSPDALAFDGLFTGAIPLASLAAGQMVRWRVQAADAHGNRSWMPEVPAPNPLPKEGTPEYAGTVAQLPNGMSALPVLHWFTPDPVGAGTRTGARASVFYQGEFYDNLFVRVRGGSTANLAKRSYKLDFNRGYRFRFDPAHDRVSEINLNTTYTDKTFVRQNLSFDVYDQAGAPGCVSFLVRLQQNGAFHSLAAFVEQPNDDLLEREGLDREGALYKLYNTFTSGTSGVEKKNRKQEGNEDLIAFVAGISSLTGTALENFVFDHVNVPVMLNHLAATVLSQNNDNMAKNYYVYRDSDGTGEWMFLPWDVDLTFGRHFMTGDSILGDTLWADQDYVLAGAAQNVPIGPSHPFVGTQAYPGNRNWNRLMEAMLKVDRFKDMFRRRLRTLMDEILQPPGTPLASRRLENRLDELALQLGNDAALDNAKWPYTYGTPQTMPEAMDLLKTQYLDVRRTHLFVTHLAANAGHYSIPNAASALLPAAQAGSPRLEFGIVEFNPASGNQQEEFLQLTNPHPVAVDLSGWRLDGAVEFTFAPGTVVLPGGALSVSPNVAAFRARASSPRGGEGHFVQGNYRGQLSARGETVRLLNRAGLPINTFSYAGSPSLAQQYLRVTEIHYHPAPLAGSLHGPQEFEFVELKNIATNVSVDVRDVRFAEGIQFAFSNTTGFVLAPGETVVLVKNPIAFADRYGAGLTVGGTYTGALDNAGERLRLLDAAGEEILDFSYNNAWYPLTDGLGFSLVVVDELAEPDAWNRKSQWRVGGQFQGTPGGGEPAALPFAPVRINEALTHTEAPPPLDTIELFNPDPDAADVSGWFLSDDVFAPFKYRLPEGTILGAGEFLIVDETQFNAVPGSPTNFVLSADGDEVYLFAADTNGMLTGYVHGFAFGAAEDGVSFGRYVTSQGEEHFVPQMALTLGATNAGPRVGPVVLSEVLYHPAADGTNDRSWLEFVELTNLATNDTPLFDATTVTNTWRLAGGMGFTFPTNTTLAAGESVVVVGFDPADATALGHWQSLHGVATNTRVFGPFTGGLNNQADTVELQRPALIRQTNVVYVRVDRLDYSDTSPWPALADGQGAALRRLDLQTYGNDPINWTAALPSPGERAPTGNAPVLILRPQDQGVAANQTLALEAGAQGAPPLRYQWFFEGVPLVEQTNATLVITNLQPEQAGAYSLAVLNPIGAITSAPATVTVLVPPTILQHPAEVKVLVQPDPQAAPETNATFIVAASSPTALRYQWRFNGLAIAGATNSAFTLVNVRTGDWGQYSVTVANDVTTVESDPAWLLPLVKPAFTELPLNQNVVVGKPVTLSAAVSGWPPPFRFQWRLVSTPVQDREQIEPLSFYTFVAPATETQQRYRVVVFNPALPTGMATALATVTTLADTDGNGLPDVWETATGLTDAHGDPDGDGSLNWEEYLAGTDPTNAASVLRLERFSQSGSAGFKFPASSNKTFTVQFADDLSPAEWQRLTDVAARPTNRVETVLDSTAVTNGFYRVVTPRQP